MKSQAHISKIILVYKFPLTALNKFLALALALPETLAIGADLAGAVGANAPKGKGSVGACTQRKNCHKHNYKKMYALWSIDSHQMSGLKAKMHQIRFPLPQTP